MRRTVRRGGLLLPSKPAEMINRPTVMPATGIGGQGIPVQETDPFFSLEVENDGTTAQDVILFDGGGGLQLGLNLTNGPDITIKGLTADYQFILNDIVHNGSFFSMVKMHVVSTDPNISPEDVALLQYGHSLHVYSSSKGSKPRLTKNIHPSSGVNEQQYHFNINTFTVDLLIGNREAILYTQEPKTRVVWSIYQTAEVGRIQ
ncbi:MAG: hypothetical protein AAFP08_08715 [Bacteroidota bacterium]